MAKQTGLIKFTGQVGGLIGYKVGGEYYLRSAAQQVRQSVRTQLAGRAFGKAATLGAAMRHALNGILDGPTDGASVNRLTKALLQVLHADDLHRHKRFVPGNIKRLKGFAQNPHAALSNILTVTPAVQRDVHCNLHVTIPPMEAYHCNPHATHLSFRAVAVQVQSTFDRATATSSAEELIPAGLPSREITLVVPAAKGAVSCVLLEVACLREEKGRMYRLQNRKYTATDIIAVMPGRAVREKRKYRRHTAAGRWSATRKPLIGFCLRESG